MTHPVRFTAAITHEGQWYVARCLEVGVTSQGESLDQALDNLREALELYFEDVDLTELPVTPILAPVTVELPQP
jgi:predicted RNase H-like HicB family nuclease